MAAMGIDEDTMIYRLGEVLDDPKFEGFDWDARALTGGDYSRECDFTHFDFDTVNYEIPRLKGRWDRPTMLRQEKVAAYNDFPACPHVPVFSQRAVSVLFDFLEPNGELLPLTTKRGKYFAFQTLTIADGILNVTKTKGSVRKPPIFDDVSTYSFYKSKLSGLTIFRVREEPSTVLVTLAFKQRIESNGLLGFDLEKVWPVPSRAEEIAERAIRANRRKVKAGVVWRDYQKETVVIRLPLTGDSPSTAEGKKLDKFRSALDEKLVLRSPKDAYFGSIVAYGGSEESDKEDKTYCIYLNCPEAQRLIDYIKPEISSLKWKGDVKVSKRNAPYWDEDAVDKFVELT